MKCDEAVANIIVREKHFDEMEIKTDNFFITQDHKGSKKFHNCSKVGYLANNCWSKKSYHVTRRIKETVGNNFTNEADG